MAITKLRFPEKLTGDQLSAEEFNRVPSKIDEVIDAMNEKVGDIRFEGGQLVLYDAPDGNRIGAVNLSGTVYSVVLASDTTPVFYVLTSEDTRYISVTPTTQSGTIGGSMSDFVEDYDYTVAVDNGNGSFREVVSGFCRSGSSIRENIRSYLAVGSNRLRLTVTGQESGQVKTLIYTVTVTTLSLESQFSWWRPFIEGQSFAVDGLLFGGNLQKTLYVCIDDDPGQTYTASFSSATSYVTTAYSFDLSSRFPTGGTGVHKLEVWMAGEGVETAHYTYHVMCVAASDVSRVSLVCVNSVASKAVNYTSQALFEFATYNATSVTFDISVSDGNTRWAVVEGQVVSVQTQTRQQYATALEVDTEIMDSLEMTAVATAGDSSQTVSLPVDNSNSYAATEGAAFYMNAALRTNGMASRTEIPNTAPGASVTSYPAQWHGFAWSVDGWNQDSDGNRCLAVAAGCGVSVPGLKPLATTATGSLTLEMKVRMANIADYDTPILSFMSTDDYSEATTCGIILFPTRIVVLSTTEREVTPQSVNLSENSILHIVIVLQRQYGATGRNLCRIYVNGIQNAVFEYAGNASFGNGSLVMGQESSDLYLYMMRWYVGRALEHRDILANFLNTIKDDARFTRSGVRADNNIMDGGAVSYDLCKAAGYNCMVIETENDVPVPSLEYTTGAKTTLTMEYNDHPEWNFSVQNAPIGGQGTTSMRYYRWNFRWKMKKDCVWTYADGTTETGKGGYIAGRSHPKCEKVTAKKNYASSQQGHKMGATAMYDELYEQLGLKNSLPAIEDRVAVYQHPAMGFQKFADGSYVFIGLYTIGPDKGDKKTFGYDTDTYPSLLSLEGPNHAPLGTRFLHPWTDDVDYDPSQETLTFGGEEAWDVDVCPYETDGTSDDWVPENRQLILSLLEREWKPAYDIVYYCSPYLRSLSEIGMTLEQLNASPGTFRNRMDILGNRKNEVLQFYDESYNLIYYRTAASRYEVLTSHNMLEYLAEYLTTHTPDTSQLVLARAAKFRAEADNYWSIDDACYHDCFCELTGSSDNHAKNSYPFKFRTLDEGGRWAWRQDDLDTIMATDNNGQSTKSYSIEVGDITEDGTDIFQGASSVFWTLIGGVFLSEKRQMMTRMVNSLVAMAQRLGVSGAYVHESVLNMFSYYFWDRSARYFPATAYNEDAAWSYILPWSIDPSKTYNNVYPLTQALGDQVEAERLWVTRRILYIFSLYQIAGFTGSGEDGYGRVEFTPAETFTFHLVPAVDMYPSGNRGGGNDVQGGRTRAGEQCAITATSDGSTTFYLKALDWLTSLGDLCSLVLTNRGGDASVGASFSVSGKRLRFLKVGDEDAAKVRFNAGSLAVNGEAMEVVDARNVVSLRSNVSLLGCPRLKRALFNGTNVPTLYIPRGAKITEVAFPSGLQTLFLHTLPLLQESGMSIPDAALTTITGIYYYQCPGISPFSILRRIFQTAGNVLQFLTMIWTDDVSGTSEDLDMLAAFAGHSYDPETGEGYGSVVFDADNNILSNSSQRPDLQGVINIAGNAYEDSANALREYFGASLTLNITGAYYIRFSDDVVRQLCATNWGDGTGLTREQAAAVSSVGTIFMGNTEIVAFDELRLLSGLDSISESYGGQTAEGVPLQSTFYACTSLVRVSMPPVNITYGNIRALYGDRSPLAGCTSLTHVDWGMCHPAYTHMLYYGCTSLDYYDGILPKGLTSIGNAMFFNCRSLTRMIFYEGITEFGESLFQNCLALRYVVFPASTKVISLVSLTRDAYTGGIHIAIRAINPPACSTGGYNRTMHFYVPDESVDTYKATPGWSTYVGYINPISKFPYTI
ncbi:MAG: leucine-rich repeat protein [Prevotella sp.]|nr:leucine-rich repeat protein [Prevotella sp.]